MEIIKADIADEDGIILHRDIEVSLIMIREPNSRRRSWHGSFSIPYGSRQLDVRGRYRLIGEDGRQADFYLRQFKPNTSRHTFEITFELCEDFT